MNTVEWISRKINVINFACTFDSSGVFLQASGNTILVIFALLFASAAQTFYNGSLVIFTSVQKVLPGPTVLQRRKTSSLPTGLKMDSHLLWLFPPRLLEKWLNGAADVLRESQRKQPRDKQLSIRQDKMDGKIMFSL